MPEPKPWVKWVTLTLSLGDCQAIIDAALAGMPDIEPALKDDTYDAIKRFQVAMTSR